MRRAFRGKICAYCNANTSETDDHIVGRGFFPKDLRNNLPKVPACKECNSKKAAFERYAMAVLPFGSTHSAGESMLRSEVAGRLDNDPEWRRQLRGGMKPIIVRGPGGILQPTSTVPIDISAINELLAMVIRGLVYDRTRKALPGDHRIGIMWLTDLGIAWFREYFISADQDQYVNRSLADGAFSYESTQSVEEPFLSAWILSIYGRLSACTERDGRIIFAQPVALTVPGEHAHLIDAFLTMEAPPPKPDANPDTRLRQRRCALRPESRDC